MKALLRSPQEFHRVQFVEKRRKKTTPPRTRKHQRQTLKQSSQKFFNLMQLQKAEEGLATQSTKNLLKLVQ